MISEVAAALKKMHKGIKP